jgi:hypothetical protein
MVGACDTTACAAERLQGLRQSKIEHLHGAVVAQLDVRGLEIAMDDALLVSRLQRLGDLTGDRKRLIERHGRASDVLGQRLPVNELHDQRRDAVRFLQSVDLGDVRVIQGSEDFRFALKASKALHVTRQRLRQHLDGDGALQVRVGGAINLTHAARAQRRDDLIRPEPRSGSESHAESVDDSSLGAGRDTMNSEKFPSR